MDILCRECGHAKEDHSGGQCWGSSLHYLVGECGCSEYIPEEDDDD